MNIKIREMTNEDYPAVYSVDVSAQKQYLDEDFENMSEDERESHLISRKSEFSINVSTGFCFVAEIDDKIVGFIFSYETLPFKGTLFLSYICINPDYQNKGIGPLLYEGLIEKAKRMNIKKIKGLINVDNPKSIRFHEKIGFKLSDRKEAVLNL